MREDPLEIQIQWILSYVQKELADVWKENFLEELEIKEIDFTSIKDFGKIEEEI